MRPGDTKQLLGSEQFRSDTEGLYEVDFWQVVSRDGAFEGVGFTVTGSRKTDFLTWSSADPFHVWTNDDQVHVVYDLCIRGLHLSDAETKRFMLIWKGPPQKRDEAERFSGFFATYQRSRRDAPPQTYTLSEVLKQPWGKPLKHYLDHAFKSPFAGPPTEAELEETRRDLA